MYIARVVPSMRLARLAGIDARVVQKPRQGMDRIGRTGGAYEIGRVVRKASQSDKNCHSARKIVRW